MPPLFSGCDMVSHSELLTLLEEILEIKIGCFAFTFAGNTENGDYSGSEGAYEAEFSSDGISLYFSYDSEEQMDERKISLGRRLAELYFNGKKEYFTGECTKRAELVERIISGTDIDSVLNEIVNLLISPLNFKFAGMFILNEILLELRGLVFARRGTPEDTSSLQFRSKKVRISKKSPLSDVMYFNRPGLISLDSIEDWKNMDEYMSGEVLACPLIGSDGKPVGIVIAGAEDYERKNTAMLRLYSHIASLAMSNRNMRDELERLKNYEDDFDKVDYVSKDLVKMGMLAATVAHELKNPLVAIGGFAKRLAGFCADPRMDNYIKMIQSEVSRLENLVTEILDYSKNVDLKIEKLHLDKVVSDTLRLMAESLSVGMIHVSKTIEPDILVYVDKNRFTQVLINIIINAVQVMPSGGDLKIYSEEGPETTILYIKDTGGGVPQEEMDKIFEPFHSSKQDGTGLGLSLCKKIINAHGGHISVTNDDTGAVFSLILPRAGGFDV